METTTVERIIAKIDNDFNPNNSDWIPRVGAWCVDVLQQLNVLLTETVTKELVVKDRIAYSPCDLSNLKFKVLDENNCEIEEAKEGTCCSDVPFTGEEEKQHIIGSHAVQINTTGYPFRYNVKEIKDSPRKGNRNYVVSGCKTIELNFDTDKIKIQYETVQMIKSDNGCEYPAIPNNGKLIECIVYYCMYKMLCRGYQHPVFNLSQTQYGTNPYYIYKQLEEEARRSVINDGVDEDVTKLFRSSLFIQTFYPRG